MKNNININNNDKTDLYCVDCREVTRQKYKGIYNDGTHQFICQECGCENYMTDRELNGKDFIPHTNRHKDCLSCANSFSDDGSDGDILRCMLHGGKIVKEDKCCND